MTLSVLHTCRRCGDKVICHLSIVNSKGPDLVLAPGTSLPGLQVHSQECSHHGTPCISHTPRGPEQPLKASQPKAKLENPTVCPLPSIQSHHYQSSHLCKLRRQAWARVRVAMRVFLSCLMSVCLLYLWVLAHVPGNLMASLPDSIPVQSSLMAPQYLKYHTKV